MSNKRIKYVEPDSPAFDAGIEPGDELLKINDKEFNDILEYRYLSSDSELQLEIKKQDGSLDYCIVETDYDDLGIEFEDELIDKAKSCSNKCIFCFIDQLPDGMRETCYFKDDDTRLSFLQGNYVTLTNLSDEDISRLIRMHVSPMNISVHTTNPDLRVKMLSNRFAGKIMGRMRDFAAHEMYINAQIVLCPDINDGVELERTLRDLASLCPYMHSVSVVPVGLSAHRDGLYKLRLYTAEECKAIIHQVEALQEEFLDKYSSKICYLADEFYLNAGIPIPPADDYDGFPQIENGVGLVASMLSEFNEALEACDLRLAASTNKVRRSIATGELAYEFIKGLSTRLENKFENLKIDVYPIKNNFFGGGVNVAGLVCGGDLIEQTKDKIQTKELYIPSVMLRDGEDVFLDDITLKEVENVLGVKVITIDNDGFDFVEKIVSAR